MDNNTNLFFLIFNLSRRFEILDRLMVFTTVYVIYLSVLLTVLLALKGGAKEKKAFLLTILGIPAAFLLINLIHLIVSKPRPFVALNLSPLITEPTYHTFPSIHATIMAIIAFSYAYFKSKWAPFFLLLMLWVGVSRIFVGVHYPLDILGGIAVGILAIFISLKIKKFLGKFFLPA